LLLAKTGKEHFSDVDEYQKQIVIHMVKGEAIKDAPMREYTTLRIGGKAELMVSPQDIESLRGVILFAQDSHIPYLVIGNGSNLLVKDSGIAGIVINLRKGFNTMKLSHDFLWAQAGCSLRRLIDYTSENSLSGLEYLSGIPGSVGGALAMNAGAQGKELGDFVHSLEIMGSDGNVEEVERGNLEFSYRSLKVEKGAVILSALFKLNREQRDVIEGRKSGFLKSRKEMQPIDSFSAGCVFKNPPGLSAGKLIEEVGLKGMKVGGAVVSPLHANFIINSGDATAQDVITLIGMIKKRVYEEKGIEFELEIQIVGED
jgi:UDP-N-acetylmuramate dehydrogenase